MQINERLITLSKAYIITDTELELGQDITLLVTGSVTQATDKDNQDGTVNRIYTIKGIFSEKI